MTIIAFMIMIIATWSIIIVVRLKTCRAEK